MRCACGKFAKPRKIWVGFGKFLNGDPECESCAAKRRMTLVLRREVERARMIRGWHVMMDKFMGVAK